MQAPVFNEKNGSRVIAILTCAGLFCALWFAFKQSPVQAANSLAIDHNEPVDRRVIALQGCSSERWNAVQLAAKQAEAVAMIRWFKAKQRIYETELKQHTIEAEYNKQLLARLQGLTGAVAEKTILESQKRVAMDTVETEQLLAFVETSKADVEAAMARHQFLLGECK
jgi:hypothetical protein